MTRFLGIIMLSSSLLLHTAEAQQKKASQQGPERWEATIANFEAQDKQSPPKPGGILFVGSSSIRLWDLQKSFPGLPVINRGFGGSEVIDSLHFADRIVIPYKPRTIVMYAGDNDISRGTTPEQVQANFRKFVAKVGRELPQAKIVFIAIKPSIKRWGLVDTMRDANRRIESFCAASARLSYVDIDKPMLGDDGKPRVELFAKDGLHLNAKGYKLWTSLVHPHLAKIK